MARRALILLGPPGAGKGTQGRQLAAQLDYPTISTGDVLREAVRKQTELGKKAQELMEAGELVPDGLVNEIVRARLADPDCARGFILDGYPRTISQAEFFERLATREGIDTLAIGIMVDDQILVERLSSRRSCPSCGKIYNLGSNPSRQEGRCDECGSTLVQRKDDSPEVVRERLQVYHQITRPLIQFYKDRSRYVEVDGSKSVDEIYLALIGIVNAAEQGRSVSS